MRIMYATSKHVCYTYIAVTLLYTEAMYVCCLFYSKALRRYAITDHRFFASCKKCLFNLSQLRFLLLFVTFCVGQVLARCGLKVVGT